MNYIFFHSRDLDGHCSGAIARSYHEQNHLPFHMIPIDYGDDFNFNFSPEDTVYFLDWTLQPSEKTLELAKKCNLIIIDHHQTSSPYVGLNGLIVPDNSLAGCQLAAKWFFKTNYDWVDLLGEYDTWKNGKNWETEVLPFQYGMRVENTDPATDAGMFMWKQFLYCTDPVLIRTKIKHFISTGSAILVYERKLNIDKMKNAFEFEFEGLRVLACVTTVPGSQQFNSRYSAKHDLMMAVTNVENKYWTVSMYTTKDIDLSIIAQKWGGGGHKRACGFQVIDFSDIFKHT